MSQTIHVECKTCGVQIDPPLEMDKEEFSQAELQSQPYECEEGHIDTYDKEDYFFADE